MLTILSRYVLWTIPILRQYICRLFQTQPLCQHKYSTDRQQKLPFSEPTQSSCFGWRNLGIGPLLGSDFGSPSRFDSKIQTEADYFEKIDEFIILTGAQWFRGLVKSWYSFATEISTKVFKNITHLAQIVARLSKLPAKIVILMILKRIKRICLALFQTTFYFNICPGQSFKKCCWMVTAKITPTL